MLPQRPYYLILVPVALFLTWYSIYTHSGQSTQDALAAYRQEQNYETWYHVDEGWGHSWQSDTFKEREDLLFDGTRRFIRTSRHSRPKLLFLVLTEDESSWGADNSAPARTFADFLALLDSTGMNLGEAALGIMTSSAQEYNNYRNATLATAFSRVTLLLKPNDDESKGTNLYKSRPRGGRHDKAFQTVRRANIALLRNELQVRALHDERHIVWIDSDIQHLSPNIIQTMIHHSETQYDASIITALCNTSWWPDYDKNAFQGFRPPPASHVSADPAIAWEEARAEHTYVGELIKGTGDDDLIPLDSVGGTVLYVRADLVHQGLMFSPYYVIGTRWGMDGWEGLETQGLCYVAKYLRGGGCWTLGGGHYVTHTNH